MVNDFTQQESVSYEETLSPVLKFAFVHTILTLISQMDLNMVKMSAVKTFLYEELDKEIVKDQRKLFAFEGRRNKVCRV